MKVMKKGILLILVLVLLSTVAVSANQAGDSTVTATVHPRATLELGFDSFSFEGNLGQEVVAAQFNEGDTNTYFYRVHRNLNIYVRGLDFTNPDGDETLTVNRLSVTVNDTDTYQLQNSWTLIEQDSGSGWLTDTSTVDFNLNLLDEAFEDDLASLEEMTQFETTVTFSLSEF